jgi:hypothetical protein
MHIQVVAEGKQQAAGNRWPSFPRVKWGGVEQSSCDASAVHQACQPGIVMEITVETE